SRIRGASRRARTDRRIIGRRAGDRLRDLADLAGVAPLRRHRPAAAVTSSRSRTTLVVDVTRRGRRSTPTRTDCEDEMITAYVLIAVLAVGLLLGSSVRVVTQYERGVILRFGRLRAATRGPGLALIAPFAD